ncbi:MAG: hypothetical protein ACYTEL_16810 [Planctomycetota bacterium]|jgi:hypothetical protein
MKTMRSGRHSEAVLVTLVLLASTPSVFAYPPDNAAVLYNRAYLLYQPNVAMEKAVSDLSKGKIKLDKRITEYVRSQHKIIESVAAAANIPKCDWGYDYSQGGALVLPHLSTAKNLAKLVMADAKILGTQGKYRTSLQRCLTLKKMARHVSDRPLITHLVGIAIDDLANDCIVGILAQMGTDLETFKWFKGQLAYIEKMPFSFAICIDNEMEMTLLETTKEKKEKLLRALSDERMPHSSVEKIALNRVRTADDEFFKRNADYLKNHMAALKAAIDLPYPQAYAKMETLSEKPAKDTVNNPDATLTAVFAPAMHRVYELWIKAQTDGNAIKAAIEIYIKKAETGQLPDSLPAGLPKDLFSGKDFEYERRPDGFALRCRGKELSKDEIHEYEFKVK